MRGPSTGSRYRVTTSLVSRRFAMTRWAVGVIGRTVGDAVTVPTARAASVLTGTPVEIQEPHPRRLQARQQLGGDPREQRVAQRRIVENLLAKTGAIDGDGADGVLRPGVEGPPVRSDEPTPTHDRTRTDRLDDDRGAPGRVHVDRDESPTKEVEGVGALALATKKITRRERHVARTTFNECDVLVVQSGREGVGSHELGDGGTHVATPRTWTRVDNPMSDRAIAAASSVMSMPTGHQAMHRPHPTQPVVSNWSHQVESLWVIHWR